MLIDQHAVPGDALCGGFLSWATLAQLGRLGLSSAMLGGPVIRQVALFTGTRETRLSLPAPGMGLSRHRLDSLLRAAAIDAGAQLQTGHVVRNLSPDGLVLDNGAEQPWHSLFLATGKHDLRGARRTHDAPDPELGLRLKIGPDPAFDHLIGDRIELHMIAGGYVGILLQEDGRANICMAVRKSRLTAAGGRPATLFTQLADASPPLAARLAARLAAMPATPHIDAIGHVPYGWRARDTWPGLYRLGDQAAVIPSLAGEGIGIALASAQRATGHWLREGRDGALRYQQDFTRSAALPLRAAATFRRISDHPRLLRALAATPGAARIAMALTRIAAS